MSEPFHSVGFSPMFAPAYGIGETRVDQSNNRRRNLVAASTVAPKPRSACWFFPVWTDNHLKRGPRPSDLTEEVVKSYLVLGEAKKIAVGSHHDFDKAVEAEAVVKKIEPQLKAQNRVFEGIHELPPEFRDRCGDFGTVQ